MKNIGGYKPGQLLLKIGGLDFLKTLETEEYFSVSHIQPECVLKTSEGGNEREREREREREVDLSVLMF